MRKGIRRNNEAVSEVVSSLLSITLISSIISGILLWGVPYIESTKTNASMATVMNQLGVASDSVEDMIQESSGSARQHEVVMNDGTISVDPKGDRLVILYDIIAGPRYRFIVDDISDTDGKFKVNFTNYWPNSGQVAVLEHATAYWFSEQATDQTVQTPSNEDIINYNNVKFTWSPPPPGECRLYQLKNYSSQWGSTTEGTMTYYNLPDRRYWFLVDDESYSHKFSRNFTVVEGFSTYQTDVAITPPSPPDNITTYTLSCQEGLSGTVRIDLFDDSTPPVLFGRVFIFDLGLIECKFETAGGTYKIIMENNGIFSIVSETGEVKKDPMFFSEEDFLSFRIVQMRNAGASSGGSFGVFKVGFHLVENYVREMYKDVLNVRIQVYGPHTESWVNYFERVHSFQPVVDNRDYILTPGNGQRKIVITQSLCTVELL